MKTIIRIINRVLSFEPTPSKVTKIRQNIAFAEREGFSVCIVCVCVCVCVRVCVCVCVCVRVCVET